jgi:hypothetical protein
MRHVLLLPFMLLTAVCCSVESQAQTWSALGTGVGGVGGATGASVYSMEVFSGNLYVGGNFTSAGGSTVYGLAKWDGVNWTTVGSAPSLSAWVLSMKTFNSNLYIGGYFLDGAGISAGDNIIKWDGTSFSAVGSGLDEMVKTLTIYNSELQAGGGFSLPGGGLWAHLTGSSWTSIVSGGVFNPSCNSPKVNTLAVYNNELCMGGNFINMGTASSSGHVTKWNGTSFSSLGIGLKGNGYCPEVNAMGVYNGELYAGGWFDTAGGVPAANIAKWNGTSWSAVGNGVIGAYAKVSALHVFNGKLYVGGTFTYAGTVPAANFAVWDGTTWSSIGAGTNGPVHSLTDYNGDLYVGGDFTTVSGTAASKIAKLTSCTAPPAQPAAFTGSTSACMGTLATYSVPPVTGAWSYTWTLPAGWTGVSNNNTITSTVGSGSGNITVSATNLCGTSVTQTINVTVSVPPAAFITVSGPMDLCQGDSVLLTANSGAGYTYQWLQTNTNIPGATSSSYSANSTGVYSVKVTNGPCSATSTGAIVTKYPPPSPIIVKSGAILIVSQTYSSYQWYLNGVLIPGATGINYVSTQPGTYHVVVTDSHGCTGPSNPLVITGVNDLSSEAGLNLFPNPNNGVFTLKGEIPISVRSVFVTIRDVSGKLVHHEELSLKGELDQQIDLRQLPAGVYNLQLKSGEWSRSVNFSKE